MQEYKVLSTEVFKQGVSAKNNKPWTIYKAVVEGRDGFVTGFDKVEPGSMVTIEAVQNGEYTNYNYKAVKNSQAAPSASPASGGSDKTNLRVLVFVAELLAEIAPQVGLDRDAQSIKQQIADILERKD